jgi:hypothetical protein
LRIAQFIEYDVVDGILMLSFSCRLFIASKVVFRLVERLSARLSYGGSGKVLGEWQSGGAARSVRVKTLLQNAGDGRIPGNVPDGQPLMHRSI